MPDHRDVVAGRVLPVRRLGIMMIERTTELWVKKKTTGPEAPVLL
jgi:hypothetical protein